MATEVRIQLATYLKDAGIKASAQQIDALAKKVKTVNAEMQSNTDATANALGKLPGAFGKVQNAIGGLMQKAMAAIGAFKVGWDIGKWMDEHVIMPLFKIKDPIEELKKHNRELKRQAEEAAAKWGEALQKWSDGWEKAISGADRARQSIEDATQAYLKMHDAMERVQSASDDATMLGMERDRFNAMAGAASPEQAAQLGKYHDVLIAEEKLKQQVAQFDRQAEVSAEKQASAEEQLARVEEKRSRLKFQMMELDQKLRFAQSQASVDKLGFEGSVKAEEDLLKRKAALQKQLDAAERDVANRQADVDAMSASRQAEAQERANMEERAKLEIDEKKKAYDDYLAEVEEADKRLAEEEWASKQDEIKREAEMELRERQKVEQALAAQRISDLRTELSERQAAESDARSRQSAAAGSLSQAWGWYRDQSSMQAAIDEHKAQAAAEVQWQKDFERLKSFKRDWRTADFGSLSAADEAVRQVAFAKEEKAAADRAVIETAENTRELADKLDELLQAKG